MGYRITAPSLLCACHECVRSDRIREQETLPRAECHRLPLAPSHSERCPCPCVQNTLLIDGADYSNSSFELNFWVRIGVRPRTDRGELSAVHGIPTPPALGAQSGLQPAAAPQRPVLLVVDDDDSVREALHLILDDDYSVLDVPNGPT